MLAQGIQALDRATYRYRRAIERKGAGIAEHPGIAIDTARDEHGAGAGVAQMLRGILGAEHVARTDNGNLDGVGHLIDD